MMTLNHLSILAMASNPLEIVSQSFRAHPLGKNLNGLLVLGGIALVVAVTVLIYYAFKRRSAIAIDDPQKLFVELCRAHSLNQGQRRTLLDLVAMRNLKDPNLVMLDASQWVLDPNSDIELCQPKNCNRLLTVQRILFSSDTACTDAPQST